MDWIDWMDWMDWTIAAKAATRQAGSSIQPVQGRRDSAGPENPAAVQPVQGG